jgi:hypothetical protein
MGVGVNVGRTWIGTDTAWVGMGVGADGDEGAVAARKIIKLVIAETSTLMPR